MPNGESSLGAGAGGSRLAHPSAEAGRGLIKNHAVFPELRL